MLGKLVCVDSLSSGLLVSSKLGIPYGGGWFYLYRPWSSSLVILIDQRTAGNSSIQRLPLLRSLSKVFVLRPRNTSAFALSAWPLLRGVCHASKTDLAAKVLDVLHEGVACELCAIVGDDSIWHTKTVDQSLEKLDS